MRENYRIKKRQGQRVHMRSRGVCAPTYGQARRGSAVESAHHQARSRAEACRLESARPQRLAISGEGEAQEKRRRAPPKTGENTGDNNSKNKQQQQQQQEPQHNNSSEKSRPSVCLERPRKRHTKAAARFPAAVALCRFCALPLSLWRPLYFCFRCEKFSSFPFGTGAGRRLRAE